MTRRRRKKKSKLSLWSSRLDGMCVCKPEIDGSCVPFQSRVVLKE